MKWHRLIADQTAGGRAVDIACFACGETGRLADMLCDTKGPAFQAYYHPSCLPKALIGEPVTTLRSRIGTTQTEATNG